MGYRTKFIDPDTRRQPKTDRFCVRCQKDIKPQSPTRAVHLVDGGPYALYPDDERVYAITGNTGSDLGMHLLGMDCAKTIGTEWTHQ